MTPHCNMRVVDLDRQVDVVSSGRLAHTFGSRLVGLLGTPTLAPGEGLLLDPCNSIHMFFMRYPIDAVYLDMHNTVVHLTPNLAPWRIGPTVRRARRVLELPAGQIAQSGVTLHDRFAIMY